MPTYTFRCNTCARTQDTFMSIGEYTRAPPVMACCAQPMERAITVAPGLAVHNALASERHYEGLRATDGTPIDSRAKHRAYMKANGLTTSDDFAGQWARQKQERDARLAGADSSRASDLAAAITRLGG